jgi:uncharacterized protein YmfQ (DUF2313 family)
MELLPSVYESNATMQELQGILTTDINELASSFNETIDECFISTASTLLSRYEKVYGLQVDVSKSDTFRRERIMAKLRGIGTTTKQMIMDTAAAYSNGSVEVTEDNLNNSFKIKFVGTVGVPANMGDLTLTIEEIKPAHLSYTFEYIYNVNANLRGFTNSELSRYTHHQLRNEVLT